MRFVARLLLVLLLASSALAQAPISGPAPHGPGWDQAVLDLLGPSHVLREAWRETTRRIVFRAEAERRTDELLAKYTPQAATARTPQELRAVVNLMLGELHLSHLAVLEPAVWDRELANEFTNKTSLRAGCELVDLDGKLFVDGLADDGPAARAGLREGDEVVTIDGAPALGHPTLDPAGHDPGIPGPHGFFLRPQGEQAWTLGVRRAPGGPIEAVTLTPGQASLIGASKASARVVEQEGRRVGVMRLWHFMHPAIVSQLKDALKTTFSGCDALVLDVRGRGGQEAVVDGVYRLFVGPRAVWDRPVVVLTHAGTRSAKEIFAWRWRRSSRGPIVGERTAGAVLGCMFRRLSDGTVLMVPVVDVRRVTNGEYLEGHGIEPTLPVAALPLPYRAGKDAILEAGLREAAALVSPAAPF